MGIKICERRFTVTVSLIQHGDMVLMPSDNQVRDIVYKGIRDEYPEKSCQVDVKHEDATYGNQ